MPYKDREKQLTYQKNWNKVHCEEKRKWAIEHPEYFRKYAKEHYDPQKYRQNYLKNREVKLERVRKYRKENPEKVEKSKRNWRNQNKEQIKEYKLKWNHENSDKVRESSRRRRNREAMADGFHTDKEWQELKKKYDWRCARCEIQEPEIILTTDHIRPLSKGGSDYIENIQPLCLRCNDIKGTKTIRYSIISWTGFPSMHGREEFSTGNLSFPAQEIV